MNNWRPRGVLECIATFWRQKHLVLLVAGATAVVTLSVIARIPKVFESHALLGVSERAVKNSEGVSAQVASAKQRAISVSNLQALIERQRLKGENESLNSAVERLRNEIRIETQLSESYPQFPEMVTIHYRHRQPAVAQRVLMDVVASFEETNQAITSQAGLEASWLDSQIADLESELASLASSGKVVRPGSTTIPVDPKAGRQALISAMEAVSDRGYALEQQVAEQKRQILEQRRILEAGVSSASSQGGAYGTLLVRKTELDAQLAEYAAQYTEKNPKVILARTQLREVNKQLSALEADGRKGGLTAMPAVHELFSLERELIRLQTDLELARRDVARKKTELEGMAAGPARAGGQAESVEATAAYDRLLNRYNGLIEQRDLMRKQEVSGGTGPALLQIIDAPNLPDRAVAPNMLMLRGLALMVAIGVGLLAVPVVEARRMLLIQDERDVAYFLAVPVLGLIPETLTTTERRVRRRQVFVRKLVVLLLAALPPAVVLVLSQLAN